MEQSNEETLQTQLLMAFPELDGKIRVQRPRRLWVDVEPASFRQVLDFLRDLGIDTLCTLTGSDEGENLSFLYHLSHRDGTVLNLRTRVLKADPVLQTVTDLFPYADLYEREVVDLFGARVEGLPEGYRYPLTDDFPRDQHPLRKDWNPAQE